MEEHLITSQKDANSGSTSLFQDGDIELPGSEGRGDPFRKEDQKKDQENSSNKSFNVLQLKETVMIVIELHRSSYEYFMPNT